MSLHFVIDGYNLINQSPRLLKKVNLGDSRAALIRFLTLYRPQGSRNNRVTIVFDGKEGEFYSRPIPEIGVIFTKGQSADEKIKNIVEKSANPKNVVVVTNDREIQAFVKGLGAQVKTIEEFIEKSGRRTGLIRVQFQKQAVKKGGDTEAPLPPQEAARITDELRKVWIPNP